MTLKNNIIKETDPKFNKYLLALKEPAKRSKKALQDALEKSVKRFQDLAEKTESEHEKSLLLKKTEKIASELDVLKVLSEDEIIRYALSVLNNIMTIASNLRIPREERIKARIAAHKPLYTHLSRLKQKLSKSQETESEIESEQDTSDPKLDKITFNNTVVSMRKDVRRAKVHVIHKLTKIIKLLRSAKGKEEIVAKKQRKAERLHKKIIHIKELHEDEVSKFALSTTQNLGQLATDVKAPTTSQALATVASHNFVAAHVTAFKTKYPDWQKIVPNLLKKKKKKRKLNLKLNDNVKNSEKMSQENTESSNDYSESESDQPESENEEESENGEDIENEEDSRDEEDSRTPQGKSNEESVSAEELNCGKNEVKSNKNTRLKNFKKTKMSPESSTEKIKVKKNVSKSKEMVKEVSPSPPPVQVKHVSEKPKVVDSFFITTTNEDYITSQVPPSSEVNSARSGKSSNFDLKNKWDITGREGKYGKFNRFQESAPYKIQNSRFDKYSVSSKSNPIVFGNRKERRKALHQPQIEEKVEKLHPSWEAKKKQSSIIPFQGKKVTFD